jgi:CheY-like chemotaxis protein
MDEIMSRAIEADFFPRASEAIKNKPRILIVDDNRDFTRSAKLALEKTGRYLVFEENDATKAHQTAQNLEPDLILLDVAMPETDGGEVAARIQSDPALHHTPIIFLTALVTKEETRSGLHIQGHSFLAKPISFSDLIEGINESLSAGAAS